GVQAPILLLEGFFDTGELELIERHDLWTVVASPWQVEALERHRPGRAWTAWLKLDTGMHRLGLAAAEFADAWQRLQALGWIGDMVAMTHFARADELAEPRTGEQLDAFDAALSALPPGTPASVANSA